VTAIETRALAGDGPASALSGARPGCEATTYIVALPAGYDLLSANDRHDYRAKARIVKQIRKDATVMARASRLPKLEVVRITAVLHPRDKRHQDSDNVQPTVKACIDAIVAAGYLPGDDERYVLSTTYMLGAPVKGSQLVLHFTPVDGAS
jgi:crossover junction endodeoxyribonuclease RusA